MMKDERCPECGDRVKIQSSKYSYYAWCSNAECDWKEDCESDYDGDMEYKMSSYYYE